MDGGLSLLSLLQRVALNGHFLEVGLNDRIVLFRLISIERRMRSKLVQHGLGIGCETILPKGKGSRVKRLTLIMDLVKQIAIDRSLFRDCGW